MRGLPDDVGGEEVRAQQFLELRQGHRGCADAALIQPACQGACQTTIAPLAILIGLLVWGYSPSLAGLVSVGAVLVIGFVQWLTDPAYPADDLIAQMGSQLAIGLVIGVGYYAKNLGPRGLTAKQPFKACDQVLVAVGRRPATRGWGLENMAVDMNGAFVKVDAQCRTSMRNVWAIGDLVGEPMLAHKASAQGEMVAEIIAGKRRAFDPVAIAAVCFTEPEIVAVGLNAEQAKAQGIEVVTGQFPCNGPTSCLEGFFTRALAPTNTARFFRLRRE